MADNTLGCGSYTAQVLTRGGGAVLFADLPVTTCSWDRRLDDTSEALVTLAGLGRTPKCFDAIRNGNPFQHEIALVRSGVPVWQGPLLDSTSLGTTGGYDARDLSAWWDRRKLRSTLDYKATDLSVIFEALHDGAMAPDSSPNFSISASPCNIVGDRKYLAGQHLLVGPLMRELSTSGIDWTVVVREAIVGGLVVPTDPIVRLDDRHIVTPPNAKKDGATMGTFVTKIGAGGGEGDFPVVGEAFDQAAIDTYGLIDVVDSNDSIRDNTSAAGAASSTLALGSTPLVTASDFILDSAAPVLIEQLVPGALIACAFRSSGIEIAGTFRLAKVLVGASKGAETVTITIQPVGTTTQGEAR